MRTTGRNRSLLLAAVMLYTVSASAQHYGRRRATTSNLPSDIGAYKNVVASFKGKLKQLSAKEILIENADGQIVSIRRSGKTKFFDGAKEIKPTDIDLETMISVDAVEDAEAKPTATRVSVEPRGAKPVSK